MSAASLPVRLRDATLEDAELLDAWAADLAVRGVFNDFGTKSDRSYAEMLIGGPLRDENRGEMLVVRTADDVPIGTVGWHPAQYGPVNSRAWNFGISLIPAARGQGYGTAESLFFTATSATTTLRFTDTSLDTVSVDALLDNVAVLAIPEPSTLVLAALGLLGLIMSRRRRAT